MSPGSRPGGHRPARPLTGHLLRGAAVVALGLTLAAQLFIEVKGDFRGGGWFAFGAVFGFAASLAILLVAKAIGWLVKRPADYPGEAHDDA